MDTNEQPLDALSTAAKGLLEEGVFIGHPAHLFRCTAGAAARLSRACVDAGIVPDAQEADAAMAAAREHRLAKAREGFLAALSTDPRCTVSITAGRLYLAVEDGPAIDLSDALREAVEEAGV